MQYRVIGLMSGSSLDGLDLAYVYFEETAGKWHFELLESACIPYPPEWRLKLAAAADLSARDYLLLHSSYGHYLGKCLNEFIRTKDLSFKVQLIASHGHTSFHIPARQMTAQLGDGAAIAAITGIRTITDLRSVDIALGGQGAPIVPIGEKLLFPDFDLYLNIGGIANLSSNSSDFVGFDICPANRVLNLLAAHAEKVYDEDGKLASGGSIDVKLLDQLNTFEYYQRRYPKSLSNDFGLKEIYPLIEKTNLSPNDALRTYVQHIVIQISNAILELKGSNSVNKKLRLLITGGGTHNKFLINKLNESVSPLGIECVVPDGRLVNFKEALIMGLMGVLRWREDVNVMQSVTGASKDSINGAVWSV
jgi:anhydro-N-acetylmuramic acid kinase